MFRNWQYICSPSCSPIYGGYILTLLLQMMGTCRSNGVRRVRSIGWTKTGRMARKPIISNTTCGSTIFTKIRTIRESCGCLICSRSTPTGFVLSSNTATFTIWISTGNSTRLSARYKRRLDPNRLLKSYLIFPSTTHFRRPITTQVVSALKYLNEIKPPVIHYDLKNF